MDRHLVAYLCLALLLLGLAALAVRARYNSRDRVLKRSRHADKARWAALARRRGKGGPPAE